MATTNWVAAGGRWFNAVNWSAGIPGSADNAIINPGGNSVITTLLQNGMPADPPANAGSLVVHGGGAVEIQDVGQLSITATLVNEGQISLDAGPYEWGGAQMNVGGALTNSGWLSIQNGKTTGPATTQVTAALVQNTGRIDVIGTNIPGNRSILAVGSAAGFGTAGSVTGSVFVANEALIQFATGQITTIAASGLLSLTGPHAYVADAGATTSNSALTGLSSVNGELDINNFASVTTSGAVSNAGTIALDATPYSFGGSTLTINGQLSNQKQVTVVNGRSDGTVDTVLTATGVSNDNTTGRIDVVGSTTAGNQAILAIGGAAGFGTVGTVTGTVVVGNEALVRFDSGQLSTIASGARLTLTGAHAYVAVVGATTSNSALVGLTSVAGEFDLQAGAAVSTSGALTNSGVLALDTGPYGFSGSHLTVGGSLSNSYRLEIFNGGADGSTDTILEAASLSNDNSTGRISVTSGGTLGNQAILAIGSAAGFWTTGVLTGTVSVSGDGIISFASGQITTIAADAALSLTGSHAFIAQAGNPTSNSALAGLTLINAGGTLGIADHVAIATTGPLSNAGTISLDGGPYGLSGSSISIGGALTNSGRLLLSDHASAVTVNGTATNSFIVSIGQSSTLTVTGANHFVQNDGSTYVDGTLTAAQIDLATGVLEIGTNGVVNGTIAFQPGSGLLQVDSLSIPANTLVNFDPGDVIRFNAIAFDPTDHVLWTPSGPGGVLQILDGSNQVLASLNFGDAREAAEFSLSSSGGHLQLSDLYRVFVGDDGDNDFFNVLAGYKVFGNGGNDYAEIWGAPALVDGGEGTDIVRVRADVVFNAGSLAAVERVEVADGKSADLSALTGGLLLQSLSTPSGAVSIIGTAGNDTFLSGLGQDTFNGSGGSDSADYGATTSGVRVTGGTVTSIGINQIGTDTLLSIEKVFGGSGNDEFIGDGTSNRFEGRSGNDTFSSGGGNDSLLGELGADTFLFDISDLNGSDLVQGGNADASLDLLSFLSAGTLTAAALGGVGGIERLQLANGTNSLALSNTFIAANPGLIIKDGTGNDTIDGSGLSAANGITIVSSGGNDSFTGGLGSDTFQFAIGQLTGADTVQGGWGAALDWLVLTSTGTITAAALGGVGGIERLQLAGGGNNSVTLTDAIAAANPLLVIKGGNNGNDTVDATALSSANRLSVASGTGNDTLRGGLGADQFAFAISELTAADTVVGAAGAAVDALNFTTAGTIAAGALSGVSGMERFYLTTGTNALTLNDAVLINNPNLVIKGGEANDTIDGTALTAIHGMWVVSNGGIDMLKGGAGADRFQSVISNLSGADTVNGGAGAALDSLEFLTTGTITASQLGGVSNIERLYLAGGSSNTLTLDDAFAGRNTALIVKGNTGSDTIDFSAFLASHGMTVASGAGNDTIRGGLGSDVFQFMIADLTSADSVQGGGGAAIDWVQLTDAGVIAASRLAGLSGIERIQLTTGTNTITLSNTVAAANSGLVVKGGGGSDVIDGTGVAGPNHVTAFGGGGADTLLGGSGADGLYGEAGIDLIQGGAGADTMTGGADADTFRWLVRDGAADAVTDYLAGVDKLSFAQAVFDFNGAVFDTRVSAASAATNITGADLVVYTGASLNGTADAAAYLSAAAGGTPNEGLFLAGTNSAGHTVLFHALDASFANTDLTFVADLGTASPASTFQLSDFAFV